MNRRLSITRVVRGAGLCAACLTGAGVQAQVTLYGVVDVSLGRAPSAGQGSTLHMMSGVQSGSRWGLHGSEDLGNGLRAVFQLEGGLLANTGAAAQGARLFGRAAWAGLASPWGELRLGRQTSVSSATLADFDAFQASYLATGAHTTLLPFNANRANHTVAYWSPKAGGWQAGVDYSFDADGQGNNPQASRLASAALVHRGERHGLALTVEGAHWGVGSTQRASMRAAGHEAHPYATTVAGTWTLSPVVLYAAWSMMHNGANAPGVGSPGQRAYFPGSTVHGAMVSATWTLGQNAFMASWQASLPRTTGSLARDGATHTQQVYSLGYVYTLSARTNLYAIHGYLKGAWADPGWHESQYAVGMRHRF